MQNYWNGPYYGVTGNGSALSRLRHEAERRWRKWLLRRNRERCAPLDVVSPSPPAFSAGSRAHRAFGLQARSEPMIRGAVCPNAGTYGSVGALGRQRPGATRSCRSWQIASCAFVGRSGHGKQMILCGRGSISPMQPTASCQMSDASERMVLYQAVIRRSDNVCVRRGLDTAALQDIAHRLIRSLVPQVGARGSDTIVAAGGIFGRHTQYERLHLRADQWPARISLVSLRVAPLLDCQVSIPKQDRVWRTRR